MPSLPDYDAIAKARAHIKEQYLVNKDEQNPEKLAELIQFALDTKDYLDVVFLHPQFSLILLESCGARCSRR